jgi:hypothetical protein
MEISKKYTDIMFNVSSRIFGTAIGGENDG